MKTIIAAIALTAALTDPAHAQLRPFASKEIGNTVWVQNDARGCNNPNDLRSDIPHKVGMTCESIKDEQTATIVQAVIGQHYPGVYFQVKLTNSDDVVWIGSNSVDYSHDERVATDERNKAAMAKSQEKFNATGKGYTPKIPTRVPHLPRFAVIKSITLSCETEKGAVSAMGELKRGGIGALDAYQREKSNGCMGNLNVGAIIMVESVDGAYAHVRFAHLGAVKYGDGRTGFVDAGGMPVTNIDWDKLYTDIQDPRMKSQWVLSESINFGR